MELEHIILKKEQGIAKIILNRPEIMNALDLKTFKEIEEAIGDIASDASIRAVIITGAGRSFCSGINLTAFDALSKLNQHDMEDVVRNAQRAINSVENLEKPVIAAINGYAMGAGLDLALVCDFRIASEKAQFGERYINPDYARSSDGEF